MTIDRLPHGAAEMVQGHIRHKRWYRLVSALACVVVFCVTYALIMPAITLTGELHCGFDEHKHTEECFTRPLLCEVEENHEHTGKCFEAADVCICGLEQTEGHSHTEQCYTEQPCYICGLEETAGHSHDPSCWQSVQSLTCTMAETDGHSHTPDCYTQVSTLICSEEHEHTEECFTVSEELICTQEEIAPHHHGEECYTVTEECICGQEESAGHTHGEDCLGTELVLSCGMEATEPHSHTEECYESQLLLVCTTEECHVHTDSCYGEAELSCGLDEHSHTEKCYTDPAADVETAADWESTLANVTLTGEWPADVLAVAESQLGYTESLTNYIIDESGARKGYTRYGAWYGVPYGDWCAMYVSFCLHYAGIPAQSVPRHSGCRSWVALLQEQGLYYPSGSGCEMQRGDIIFLDPDGCGLADHVGLIVSVEGGYLTTIEGNSSNCVTYRTYAVDDPQLYGFGSVTQAYWRYTGQDVAPLSEVEYFCGMTEHAHSDGCFDENGELICGLDEHEHTPDCLIEPQAEPVSELEATVMALEALGTLSEDDILAAQQLLERLRESYLLGGLSDGEYVDLYARVSDLLYGDEVAEMPEGYNWLLLRDSGWFEEYSDSALASYSVSALSLDGSPALLSAAEGEATVDTTSSAQQIDNKGGESKQDDVTVSKTIAGTELENVFDITLTVETPQQIDEVISEPDMAVVIVMDISNTMNDDFGGVTRYAAAIEAAEDFLDNFVENNTLGVSKVGYVAFNTDAHQIFGLQKCTTTAQATALKNTMRTATGNIINNYEKNEDGNVVDHSRFTNIEGGLKMAQDMLDGVSNKNKFIILLTDGFPTTYVSSGYNGYDPYTSSGTAGTDGVFYDNVFGKHCDYGTSYSDKAAIRAREMAATIKNSGTTIFSIGVDVGGQTIEKYVDNAYQKNDDGSYIMDASGNKKLKAFSVVDRTGTSYEIGDATSTESYKTWLKDSIGSGYYYDSTNTEGLKSAYTQIFAQIKTTVAQNTAADWVASDPIPNITPDEIDFIGFYDKKSALVQSLTGNHDVSEENTASYGDNTITWDLKKSGYTKSTVNGTEWYSYSLKYRIRLRNEDSQFAESKVYNTNGTTTLQYRVVQTVNGEVTGMNSQTIEFPIPSVHGYLGELTFTKQDNRGNALAGAEFTLHHSDTCNVCRGNGTQVTIADQVVTSGTDGTVTFSKIPSGHTYTLTETKIPDGYSSDGKHYTVTVAYDKVTVTAKDHTWQPIEDFEWNSVIVNNTSYELPATGGIGIIGLSAAGAVLMLGGALGLYRRRKRAE